MLTQEDVKTMGQSEKRKTRLYIASSVAMYPPHLYVRIRSIITRIVLDAEAVYAKGLYSSQSDFLAKYKSELNECDELLFFTTPDEHTIGRGCWFEIEYMLEQGKPVWLCTWDGVLVPYTDLTFTQLCSYREWMRVGTQEEMYNEEPAL